MNIVLFFSILIIFIFPSVSSNNNIQPRIISSDGHLTFKTGNEKNISFLTLGKGKVQVNGVDLTKAAQITDEALHAIGKYKLNFDSAFEKITNFEDFINQNNELFNKLNVLQNSTFNNSSSCVNENDFQVRISSVRRRIALVQRRIRYLSRTLARDECNSSPCENGGTCQDLYNSFNCQCPPAWEGPNCQLDVNECSKFKNTDLGCQNDAKCINTPGSYTCQCLHGWYGLHCTKTTIDCRSNTELCGHGTCLTTHPSQGVGFTCLCDQGWTNEAKNSTCTKDVDECSTGKPPCSVNPPVRCVNLPGTFTCGPCPSGYTGNGFYCIDVNECEIFNGGCSLNPQVQCINTLGSRICGNCPAGFEGNGQLCVFKGACHINNGGCHPLATCRENPSMGQSPVQCSCPSDLNGDGIGPNGCTRLPNACLSNPCKNSGTCVKSPGSYYCLCKPGFIGGNCEDALDPCMPNPCKNGGSCISEIASFSCKCTSAFTGERCQNQRESCGAELEATEGVISYPSSGTVYSDNTNCFWTIRTNITRVIRLSFTKFNLEPSKDCSKDWLQIHDGENSIAPVLGKYCGNVKPKDLKSTQNVIYLWFRSDKEGNHDGFELNWDLQRPFCGSLEFLRELSVPYMIKSPGSPGNYPSNRDCYWKLYTAVKQRFLCHFFSLDIGNNTDCSHDYLEFMDLEFNVLAKFCESTIPLPLYSQDNGLTIHFHSDSSGNYPGFQLSCVTIQAKQSCDGIYTDSSDVIKSPAEFDENTLNCRYRIGTLPMTTIRVTFTNLDLPSPCAHNFVKLYAGRDSSAPLINTFCGNNLPYPFRTSGNEIFVEYKLTNYKGNTSYGFAFKYESVCGKVFTDTDGVIETPGPQVLCIYEIIQSFHSRIALNITRLRINNVPGTNNDIESDCRNAATVEIRDGVDENSTLIGKYCNDVPDIILSTTNQIWIKFHSKFRFPGRFRIIYNSTNIGCGGVFRKELKGIFSSPERTEIDPGIKYCKWILTAPKGYSLVLRFTTYFDKVENECTSSGRKISIYANDTENGNLIAQFCGKHKPPMGTVVQSNVVTVIYDFGDDESKNQGTFLARYTFLSQNYLCGFHSQANSGVIEIDNPNFSNSFALYTCQWTLQVQSGYRIILRVEYDIKNRSSDAECSGGHVLIRDGFDYRSPTHGGYCVEEIPTEIISQSNQLFIMYLRKRLSSVKANFKMIWNSANLGCGGTVTGDIVSPEYPSSYPSTECVWKIVVKSGYRIRPKFRDLDLVFEDSEKCSTDYVEFFDGPSLGSQSLGRYCESNPNRTILSSTNQMLVKFRGQSQTLTKRGFYLRYEVDCDNVTLTGFRGVIESLKSYGSSYLSKKLCTWNLVVPRGNKINITITHINFKSSGFLRRTLNCSLAYLQIMYKKDGEFIQQSKFCEIDSLRDNLIHVNSNEAQVRYLPYYVVGNFRLEWQIDGCGGLLRKPSGKIFSPNFPNSYPPKIKCEWLIQVQSGKSAELNFAVVDIEDKCDVPYSHLRVYSGPDSTYPLIANFCRSHMNPTIISSSINSVYVVFDADETNHRKGFKMTYKTRDSDCGGKFTKPSGAISTPHYPNISEFKGTCEWSIQVDQGHRILLDLQKVDLGHCGGNSSNKLYIYDGPDSNSLKLGEFRCNESRSVLQSSSNNLIVQLQSPHGLNSVGFYGVYEKFCGGRLETWDSGSIFYNGDGRRNLLNDWCEWTIVSIDSEKHVHLTITHLDKLENGCNNRSIRILNGESSNSPILGTYCSRIPPKITSEGSALHIMVPTAYHFFATYSVFDSTCGGTLTAHEGDFASPGYPKQYPMNVECEWILEIPEGNHLTLVFSDFKLLPSEKCNSDFLEIRSGNSSGKLLGVYCDDQIPVNLTHTGSLWLFLKTSSFINDPDTQITAKGFYASYSLNYANELEGKSGTIVSPAYGAQSATYTWLITFPSGKTVHLIFKEFSVISRDVKQCNEASVTIYDGPDDTAKLLKVLCGLTLPEPLTSTSNTIFIKAIHHQNYEANFRLDWQETVGVDPHRYVRRNVKVNQNCGSNETIDLHQIGNINITSPGFPNGYGSDLKCEWFITTIPLNHIVFQFKKIRLDTVYSSYGCYYDYVEVFDKEIEGDELRSVEKLCHDNDTITFETSNSVKVVFDADSNGNGSGFLANVQESCGGLLTDSFGYIHSNSLKIRDQYLHCQWNVTVGTGKTIKVDFLEFNHTGNHLNCSNYVILRNGLFPDSPLLGEGKYCSGNFKKPPLLNTTGNNLYVEYSGYIPDTGFKLSYLEVGYDCGGDYTLYGSSYDFTINSPNYPSIPPPHVECDWVFKGPIGSSLRIDFIDRFDLSYDEECVEEFVEIRDGASAQSPLLEKTCLSPPDTLISTERFLFVRYFTQSVVPGNGFKAKVSVAKCGGFLNNAASVSFPNENVQYEVFPYNCTWHLEVPEKYKLELEFTELNLWKTNLDKCDGHDFISIHPGFLKSPIGPFCGHSNLSTITDLYSHKASITFSKINFSYPSKFKFSFTEKLVECGGDLTGSSGFIQTPNYPNSHDGVDCTWHITVPKGRRVVFEFLDNTNDDSRNGQESIYFFQRPMQSYIQSAFDKNKTEIIKSSDNTMSVYYYADNVKARGFKAQFTSNEPSICEMDENSRVIAQPQNGIWEGFLCIYSLPPPPKKSTLYFTLKVKRNADHKYGCRSYSSHIQVTLSSLIEESKFFCENRPDGSLIKFRSPIPVEIEAKQTSYEDIKYTINYSIFDCGGVVENELGTISMPGKSNKDVQCAWLLKVPEDEKIQLNFTANKIGKDCSKEFVVIYNGDSSFKPKIGTFCKDEFSKSIISQTNALWIEYQAEKDSDSTGFSLDYNIASSACGGVHHYREGVIETPGYPKSYPNSAECLWEIRSDVGYAIGLKFESRFHLEDSENCANDYLEIWDWTGDKWKSFGRNCGREIRKTFNSTSDKMRILFRSNSLVSGSGFRAEWFWQCGGTYEGSSTRKFITSPNYPDDYSSDLDCEYKLISPSSNKEIFVKFHDFLLENLSQDLKGCVYDNLTITTGTNVVTYCGENVPKSAEWSGEISISFKTDSSLERKGFRFSFAVNDCDANLTSPGIIQSPSDSSLSKEDLQDNDIGTSKIACEWKVFAPPDQVVVVEFRDYLELPNSEGSDCYRHNIEIYEGETVAWDKIIVNLCGNLSSRLPLTFYTKNSSGVVKFSSSRPTDSRGFRAFIYFEQGPAAGCGGDLNVTEATDISSPANMISGCVWSLRTLEGRTLQIEILELKGDSTKLTVEQGLGKFTDTVQIVNSSRLSLGSMINIGRFGKIKLSSSEGKQVFKAKITPKKSPCGPPVLKATYEKQFLTSPNYPNPYPAEIICEWLIVTESYIEFSISFDDFELQDASLNSISSCVDNLEIIHDNYNYRQLVDGKRATLEIFDLGTSETTLSYANMEGMYRFCGRSEKPFDFHSSFPIHLKFTSGWSLENKRGKGFKIEYSIQNCARNYTGPQGRIKTTNSTDECRKIITVDEGSTISLYFMEFVSYTNECDDAYMEVYEGDDKSGKRLLKACGSSLPLPVFSKTNKLLIYTKIRKYMIRYDLTYISSNIGQGCGGTFSNNRGKFSSPLYPLRFTNNTICEWTVKVPLKMKMRLQFSNFEIEGDCEKNYLNVITYYNHQPNEHKFCEKDKPALLNSDQDIVVRYKSSPSNNGTGWIAEFQTYLGY